MHRAFDPPPEHPVARVISLGGSLLVLPNPNAMARASSAIVSTTSPRRSHVGSGCSAVRRSSAAAVVWSWIAGWR